MSSVTPDAWAGTLRHGLRTMAGTTGCNTLPGRSPSTVSTDPSLAHDHMTTMNSLYTRFEASHYTTSLLANYNIVSAAGVSSTTVHTTVD